MKYALIFAIILCAHAASAQGIDFQKLDWETNLAEAKKSDKLIYIDFFTTWCAPCTYMAKKFFMDEAVGNFYNKNFFCLKIDAEKEGLVLAKKYSVDGYPTNLFIDPANEKIIFKTIGAPLEKSGFLEHGVTALKEKNDDMTLPDYEKKLASGANDKEFLLRYIEKLARLDLPNQKPLDIYSSKYFKKIIDSTEIIFMKQYLKSIDNKTFDVYAANQKTYNDYHDAKGYKSRWSDELSSKLYYTNQIAIQDKDETLFKKCIQTAEKLLPPYDKLEQTYYLKGSYYEAHDSVKKVENEYNYGTSLMSIEPNYYTEKNKELLASVMMQLEMQSQSWPDERKAKLDSFKIAFANNTEHSHRMTMIASQHLNTQAWNVFETKDNKRYLQALAWAKKGYEQAKEISQGETAVADTYANLLFVTGNKKKAIEVEKAAIAKAKELGDESAGYDETLEMFEKN